MASPCLASANGALQVLLGVVQAGLVLRQLGGRLVEGGLERRRVDLHEEVALLQHLPFLEGDLLDLPIDARAHRHRVRRLHGAEAGENDGKVLPLHDGDVHRSRRRLAG